MPIRSIVYTLTCLLFLTACSKDQDAVDKLDGTWKLVAQEGYVNNQLDTTLSTVGNVIYQFDGCSLNKNDKCTGREIQKSSIGDITTEFKYTIIEAGSQISFDYDEQLLLDNFSGYIQELTTDRLVFEFYFGKTDPITRFIYTLERQ
ncbi:MAG: hypothetical protein GY810_09095 [Aureispira sp.]|nr:hypothetical protein [Aureispira sp.]